MVSRHFPRPWVPCATPARLFVLWAAAVCLSLFPGCAEPAHPAPQAASAHLVVTNLTDYRWTIAISRAAGQSTRKIELEPRSTQNIDLAGDDYLIEQSAQGAGPGQDLTRRISVRLDQGKTYGWRLVTLLSGPGTGGAP